MSLNTTSLLWAGHDQPDVAALTADGEWYRCYVYLNRANWRVEAVVEIEQPGGGDVVVFHSEIANGLPDIEGAVGIPLDCPKVIAVGTTFVVHWLQCSATDISGTRLWQLYRATMDMTNFDPSISGWTNQGAVGLHEPYALFDACPSIGSSTDFVVVRSTDVNEITVERFTAFTWLDQDYTTTIALPHAAHVLACYAHEADNDLLVSFEAVAAEGSPGANYELITVHVDLNDGGNHLPVVSFASFGNANIPNGAGYLQVGHCRTSAHRVAIVVEAQLRTAGEAASVSMNWIHHVAYRLLNSATAARVGNEHWTPHLYLCSRPWAYANGTTSDGSVPDVYALVSFKSIYETNDWEQAYMFVLNFDLRLWDEVASGMGLQPRPILTVASGGIPDARASGWHPEIDADIHTGGPSKRMNHISSVSGAPPRGPDVKTRTLAIGMFARQTVIGVDEDGGSVYTASEIEPANAGVRGLRVYMEDPWVLYRDVSDPLQPLPNFKAAFPRAQCQALEAGKSLFLAGGTPGLYDGSQVFECGFPWKPEIFQGGGVAEGGLTDNSDYVYMAVYTHVDNAGQIHRSGPSRVITVHTDATENGVQLFIRSLPISLRDNTTHFPLAQSIGIEVYRLSDKVNAPDAAEPDGLFHLVWSGSVQDERAVDGPINALSSSVDGFYVSPTDTISDAHLIYHATAPDAYQFDAAGTSLVGPLPITTPAFSCVATFQNRVWGADALDPAVIWYSDEIRLDEGSVSYAGPVFAGNQKFRVGEIGEIVAMHAMNTYLIVFTASAIYALGAQDLGTGALAVSIEPLHEGTGCIEPRSVVLGPPGLFFQSAKGYHLLNRGRMLEFDVVGAQISDEIAEAGNIRSASISESDSKLKLVCCSEPVLVYTTVLTFTDDPGEFGTWILNIGANFSVELEAQPPVNQGEEQEIVANYFAAQVSLALETSLEGVVAGVTNDANTATIVWADNVVPDYEVFAPVDAILVGADSSDIVNVEPRVLVFNYFTRTWSRADLQPTFVTPLLRLSEAADGCMWSGGAAGEQLHCVLTQNALLIERPSTDADAFVDQNYLGDNVPVPIDIQTSWLSFANVVNWQRIRSIDIQGETPEDSSLFVDLETDRTGDHAHPELDTFTWSTAPSAGRIKPRIQLCSSVRVRIYETEEAALSENIAVTALVFELGVHKGPRRQSDSQTGT